MDRTARREIVFKLLYSLEIQKTSNNEEIKLFIENNGGTVTGSVSKNTDAVIVGTDPGSKYDKALTLNIKIINEEEIKQIMGK